MRARMIKPEFFSDPQLGRMPDGARILFIGLWALADREGRLVDSPLMIAGSIWPHRDDGIIDDVRRWLELLASAQYILRYEIDGSRYIQIRTFKRHQPIHPHEKSSRIPPPPQSTDTDKDCPDNVITSSRQSPDDAKTTSGQCNDNVALLLTSYLSPLPAAARKLPNTPLPPTDELPPPLTPVENPVEISPGAERQPGNVDSPPQFTDPRQAIAILAERRAMEPRHRRAPPVPSDETGLAIAVVGRMLRDWMEHRADALGPPDDALCRRLLEAHGMSLERVRGWLLGLRRRGKYPGSVQGWGWFVALAESDAARQPRAAAHAAS